MEMNAETYGKIMEQLGGIRSDIRSLDEKLDTANKNTCDRLDRIEETTEKRFEKVETRITIIEQKPGKWWDKLISAGLGAGIGAFIAKIIK